MSEYPVETSVLLVACRLKPCNNLEQWLGSLPESFDWEFLVKNAFAHGVNGLLCHSLLSVPQQLVPKEIRHASCEHLKQLAKINQKHADQLTFILGELKLASIKAIPFKGPTLAMSAYGQLNLRTFRDLDFLIREKDIQPCMDKLQKLGYKNGFDLTPRQWREFVHYTCEDILFGPGLPLEPHWAFVPWTLSQKVDYEGVWARAVEKVFNRQSVLILSPEDELMALCIHGCKEEWNKLKWVVDVSEFIHSHPALDWDMLIDHATKQGLARMVKVGLLLAQRLVQVNIPEKVNVWVDDDRRASRLVKQLTNDMFDDTRKRSDIWDPCIFHWAMREKLSDRLRYLFRSIFQPRIEYFSVITFPDNLFFLYRPYKIFHDIIALPIWKLIKKIRNLKYKNETS